MASDSTTAHRDRRTRRREGRRLGRRDSVHQLRPVEVVRPPTADEVDALAVARAWADALEARDLDRLVAWYAPEAVVHTHGDVLVDGPSFWASWAGAPVLGVAPTTIGPMPVGSPAAHEFDVVVRWVGEGADGSDVESRLRIRHGLIVEQWHGEIRRFEPTVGPPLEVATAGSFTVGEREQLTDMMWRVVERVERDVRHAGLRVQHHTDPARPAHFSGRAWLDLDHEQLHARASAPTLGALIDRVEHRLRLQLEERADRRRALRRRGTASPPGQWRHGDRPPPHPRVPARPDDERVVIVRTTWAGGAEHVDEAVEDLEALDLEVLLFEEVSTGQPAVIWHGDDGAYRLRLASGDDPHFVAEPPPVADIDVDRHPFPEMDVDSARLDLKSGQPWVAFRDVDTGRAGVLYRRVDGHDGLVVLASDTGQ